MSEIGIRSSAAADASFIYDVVEATMRCHVEATWGAWSAERVKSESDADALDPSTKIIQFDGQDCGVFCVQTRPDALWIQMLFVLPRFQRRGVGRHLLSRAQEQAQALGVPVRLRVMRVNPARHYYEQFGFRRYSEDDDFLYFGRRA